MHQQIGAISFFSNFDSGNLAAVIEVGIERNEDSYKLFDKEFQLWTSPDAAGTKYENKNRTWFHFGVQGQLINQRIKFTVMNLNKQFKLYVNGMAPVFKVVSSSIEGNWQRIKERTSYEFIDGNFQLTFSHTFGNVSRTTTTYFAFTFPYSYEDCQKQMHSLKEKYCSEDALSSGIYFHRDTLIRSVDGLNIDLLTLSSTKYMNKEEESNIPGLFPDESKNRAKSFSNKKVFLLTSRVHSGETPSSFVFNGFLNFLLRNEKQAKILLDLFVFKMVPMLNPDGVVRGHYRTDSKGVNLNRVYIDPDIKDHPSIYAIKQLFAYYSVDNNENSIIVGINPRCTSLATDCTSSNLVKLPNDQNGISVDLPTDSFSNKQFYKQHEHSIQHTNSVESRIQIYIDLHAHASKLGCFMYGNHFEKQDEQIRCMLLPKLLSLTTPLFDFSACNFSEKNMFQRDKTDGTSKEGSGRVAMGRLFNVLHSYTLECNYNCSRLGTLYYPIKGEEKTGHRRNSSTLTTKYTPEHYEEVGAGVAIATLDLLGVNPCSKLYETDYKSLAGVHAWLNKHIKGIASKKSLSSSMKKSKKLKANKTSLVIKPSVNASLLLSNEMKKLSLKSPVISSKSSSSTSSTRRQKHTSLTVASTKQLNLTFPQTSVRKQRKFSS